MTLENKSWFFVTVLMSESLFWTLLISISISEIDSTSAFFWYTSSLRSVLSRSSLNLMKKTVSTTIWMMIIIYRPYVKAQFRNWEEIDSCSCSLMIRLIDDLVFWAGIKNKSQISRD